MGIRIEELKEKYNPWLMVAYKENQDNGEATQTKDYLIFADKNYFATGDRVETLDISLFKTFLEKQVLPQLDGEKKEKLYNIIKDVKQFLK
jgi:hypothetical protein